MGWYLSSFVITTYELLCCKLFFGIFCDNTREMERRKKNLLILSMIMLVYGDIVFLRNWLLWKVIIVILIIAYTMYRYFEISIKKSCVIGLLFESLVMLVDYGAYAICTNLFLSEKMIEKKYMMEATMIVVLAKIILFVFILMLKKLFVRKGTETLNDKDWLKFLVFPAFTIIAIIALLAAFPSVEKAEQAYVLYAVALGMIGMNLVVYYLINDIVEREMRLHEKKLFELQVKEQMEMYRSISENFEKQKRRTHEFKNKILCIDGLANTQEYEKLKEYVAEIRENLSAEKNAINTNHVIVNTILNTKYEEAVRKKIVFVLQVNDLSKIWLSDEDTVVLLSNLLNNAIEACEKCIENKKIQFKFVLEEGEIILSVKNTYKEPIVYENNEIKTSKKVMPDEHGIGIKNIKKVVEKYNGLYTIQSEQGEFSFSIVISQ